MKRKMPVPDASSLMCNESKIESVFLRYDDVLDQFSMVVCGSRDLALKVFSTRSNCAINTEMLSASIKFKWSKTFHFYLLMLNYCEIIFT